jgi:hypothetical protein
LHQKENHTMKTPIVLAALLAAAPAFAQSAADELRTLNFNLQQQEMQRQFEQQQARAQVQQQQMLNTMRPQRVYGVGGACMFNCY